MYILHHLLSCYPNSLITPRVKRTRSSYNFCPNTPHNGLSPVSNVHILPHPVCYIQKAVQYSKTSRPYLCHTRPMLRHSKSKRVFLSVAIQLINTSSCTTDCTAPIVNAVLYNSNTKHINKIM